VETDFKSAGTLSKPRPIGRLVRLAFGIGCAYFVFATLYFSGDLFASTSVPKHLGLWSGFAGGFFLMPHVVNIGFGTSWRRRPQIAVGVLVAAALAVDLAMYGRVWAPPLAVVMIAWSVYVFTHLGISFLLSAVIATPGCEMRALPHLFGLVTGRAAQEHYCPGPLDRIDAWEKGKSISSQ
jgi:hypothetical protein